MAQAQVKILDTTLRDGEQTPGVVFSEDDKLRIAEGLVSIGVTRIEAGMPAVSEQDRRAIARRTQGIDIEACRCDLHETVKRIIHLERAWL